MPKFRRKSKEERCKEIQDGARKVFLKKGYRYTTMEEVIAETTLSKGGVYRYYQSTKEIMIDIMKNGNEFRFEILKGINDNLEDNASLKDVLISLSMNKLYDKHIDKKLYAMFISEMIYDKDMKEVFYEIEKESKDRMLELLKNRLTEEEKNNINKRYIFMSRIMNGLIFIDQLFDEEDTLEKNRDRIAKILETTLV